MTPSKVFSLVLLICGWLVALGVMVACGGPDFVAETSHESGGQDAREPLSPILCPRCGDPSPSSDAGDEPGYDATVDTFAGDVTVNGASPDGGERSASDAMAGSEVVACTLSGRCTPSDCRTGTWVCVNGASICKETSALDAGTPCAANGDGGTRVCSGGQCVACNAGADCSDPNTPCVKKAYDCSSGAGRCTVTGNVADGVACGGASLQFCNGGICSPCQLSAPCSPPSNPCHTGSVTKCTGGIPTCTDQGTATPAGTPCTLAIGAIGVCDGNASCIACTPNAQCGPPGNACQIGVQSCSAGPQCTGLSNVREGLACTTSGQICHAGACVACNAASCASGCCDANGCVTTAQTTLECGTGAAGAACATCRGPGAGTGGATCSGNVCGITCTGATALACGTACVDPTKDPNCGGCGHSCAASTPGAGCGGAGQCTCTGTLTLCGGTCVDTQTSKNNCGACGSTCAIGCARGLCLKVIAIAPGTAHTCALLSDGTVRCWGDNTYGQLGTGSSITSSLAPVVVPSLSGVSAIASGSNHTCALLSDGTIQCWGINGLGQLGDGSTTTRPSPVAVSGVSGAVSIAAGVSGASTCAVLSNGTVDCWGDNVGNGSTAGSPIPIMVSGIAGTSMIGAGGTHACAVVSGGVAYCWGSNQYGQLGNGTTSSCCSTPQVVTALASPIAIAAGAFHACALQSGGAVACWGYNFYDQLGNATYAYSSVPVSVAGLSGAIRVAAGGMHSCALFSSGVVACWGADSAGQVGNGTTTMSWASPQTVSGITTATAIAGAESTTCAVLSDGTARCWGFNFNGQLGNGTTVNSPTPVSANW